MRHNIALLFQSGQDATVRIQACKLETTHLWSSSIGLKELAAVAIIGAEDPSIAGMVLDSPLSNLVDLMMELVDTYKFRLPKFTVS